MTATITPQHDELGAEVGTSRRRKITKFALAGVAVLGIGAALTSAAWTDNVWFGGKAATGSVNIEGSIDGQRWFDSDAKNSIELDMGVFTVGSEQATSKPVQVRNAGTLPVSLTLNPVGEDLLFEGPDPAIVTAELANPILDPGESVTITVTVTGGEWANNVRQNQAGTVYLEVQGSSDLG